MQKTKNFLKTVLMTLNPYNLERLSERVKRHATGYFFSIVFLGFIIMALIFLPQVGFFKSSMQKDIDNFKHLNIDIDYETSEPVRLLRGIVVDSGENVSGTKAKMLINKEMVYYGKFFKTKSINMSEYKDVKEGKEGISKIFSTILILILPMLAVLLYIYFAIKFLIVIFVLGGIVYLIARGVKYELSYRETMTIAAYATTLMVLIEMIAFGIGFKTYGIQYLIFIVYLIIGCLKTGVHTKHKGKFMGTIKHKVFD